ncbi:hypothetical protein SAY87_019468 [Trapa incisa]|uniref:Uncharacterized protein n=1 Tax=Trapa incisa TaxID=236973 RepID=A0AAN7K5A7_9MYRT|nr:hypothetical protein SAY87_019468 [Trapa incisa]
MIRRGVARRRPTTDEEGWSGLGQKDAGNSRKMRSTKHQSSRKEIHDSNHRALCLCDRENQPQKIARGEKDEEGGGEITYLIGPRPGRTRSPGQEPKPGPSLRMHVSRVREGSTKELVSSDHQHPYPPTIDQLEEASVRRLQSSHFFLSSAQKFEFPEFPAISGNPSPVSPHFRLLFLAIHWSASADTAFEFIAKV